MDMSALEEPKLLRKGLIVPSEVDFLFSIYWDKINVRWHLICSISMPSCHLTNRRLSTVYWIRLFILPPMFSLAALFSLQWVSEHFSSLEEDILKAQAVCAIASRFYRERPELYSIAMHFAKTSAASTLVEGRKSIELCQAYLLLAVWSSGSTKTFDEDRGWLWLGYAIRYALMEDVVAQTHRLRISMAMDLNLHLPPRTPPLTETQEREELNRIRTWVRAAFSLELQRLIKYRSTALTKIDVWLLNSENRSLFKRTPRCCPIWNS